MKLAEMMNLAEEHRARLGIETLRPGQREVLLRIATRTPTFAALPTGYGKSLCYWMPAMAWNWRVWVISPLVSLIEDQALACEALGLPAVAWGPGLDRARRRELNARMREGRWRICFLSPERYLRWEENGFADALEAEGNGADLIALDEMHCLEDWRGFRAGYGGLTIPLRRRLEQGAAFLGLSASFSETESSAWMRELCGDSPFARVAEPLGRNNLRLRVVPLANGEDRWLLLLAALRGLRAPESALVYCWTREESDDTARWLRSAGVQAVAYHAGLPSSERLERVRAFRAGRLRIICATSAFGMGIDYPHVRSVIHFSMPRDLESYWQEVGRAGRSGGEAEAVAFWRRSEITRARAMEPLARARFLALWHAWAGGGCRKLAVAARLGLALERSDGVATTQKCGKCDRCDPRAEHGAFGAAPNTPWWTQHSALLAEWARDCGDSRELAAVKRTLSERVRS